MLRDDNLNIDAIPVPNDVLVYGASTVCKGLVFAPFGRVRLFAEFDECKAFPMTWKEFRERFGEAAYEMFAEYDTVYESFEDFFGASTSELPTKTVRSSPRATGLSGFATTRGASPGARVTSSLRSGGGSLSIPRPPGVN